MSNIRYACMKRCFSLLCKGNAVLCACNSVCGATRISPTLLSLKITLHNVNLSITTHAVECQYINREEDIYTPKNHMNASKINNSSLISFPILSSLITNLFLCIDVRYINLILSNIYGIRISLGTAYLHQRYCRLVSQKI